MNSAAGAGAATAAQRLGGIYRRLYRREHRRRGGESVVLQDRDGRVCIVLSAGERDDVLMAAGDIPATRNGLLWLMLLAKRCLR